MGRSLVTTGKMTKLQQVGLVTSHVETHRPQNTRSGCGKRKAHENWPMVILYLKRERPLLGTT